ncbi:hypothetical protein PR202_ga27617 [Eleusine coracana subsp. coracana]|uniref:BTB domain-containing protein n=1 Tax=Eleusine coracana subsp. coracana TaxID=191504 RepID=A0AAV5DHL5_ELECO|nr:hypothetical protein PR202_ga27595 [Eleusine coracana subsp. coracana]GJN09597.1 hypothetical protein PR202_ga27617 [Eleusine coracana subsp. coracana]
MISMVDAERRLLAKALEDIDNQHFVLLSDSCVPLHNFDYVYDFLMGSRHSFLDCFHDPGPHGVFRYSKNMLPEVRETEFRKGSQWFSMKRQHAMVVIADSLYYTKFRHYCRPGMEEGRNCYADEHYLPTLFHMMDPVGIANWKDVVPIQEDGVEMHHGGRDGHPHLRNHRVKASVLARLMCKAPKVRACFEISLPRQAPKNRVISGHREKLRMFRCSDTPCNSRFCLRSKLEQEGYVHDDRLTIECHLTVVMESQMCDIGVMFEIEVPPCDMPEHFARLLDQEDGSDVTFSVGGETFAAHKIVLTAQSPMFKAEFYGQMMEAWMSNVTIRDMQPAVLKAFSISSILVLCMAWYAMDRLKLMCESTLSKGLDVDTVATTLGLADQHNCDKLKEVCIEFIASSNDMNAVLVSQGYAELNRTCPAVLGDILEKTSKRHKS